VPAAAANRAGSWESLDSWTSEQIPFTQHSGPQHSVISDDPAAFFEMFVDDEAIDMMVMETNRYANQSIQRQRAQGQQKKYARSKKWRPITPPEMKNFLSLMFLTGIMKKPEFEMYWSTDEMLATPFFTTVMPRNRFELIWTYFHTVDNESKPTECEDRLFKVRPLMELCLQRFRDLYTPALNISIDEGMLLWRGRLSFRVYNPAKPIKYGIKSYVLADSDTGYCWNMKPYAGVSSTIADTITNLLDRLAGHGHQLYMDNFYNSVKVTDILLNLKTHICGTMRANRGEPAAMKAPTLQKGETLALHNGRAMLLAWKDKRIVKMVSTFHDASMQDVEVCTCDTYVWCTSSVIFFFFSTGETKRPQGESYPNEAIVHRRLQRPNEWSGSD
jgi:hypothetical protein